jgi:hypothetical protein
VHEENSYIVQVSKVANSSRQLLKRLGVEGRVIASFNNTGGNFIRFGYEFLYSRQDFVGNITDFIPAVQMVVESKTEEDEQQVYMMDASDFVMRDVSAAVAELDELPDWVGGDIEEYFPRKRMEVNEAGDIIITLKHKDSKVLITLTIVFMLNLKRLSIRVRVYVYSTNENSSATSRNTR